MNHSLEISLELLVYLLLKMKFTIFLKPICCVGGVYVWFVTANIKSLTSPSFFVWELSKQMLAIIYILYIRHKDFHEEFERRKKKTILKRVIMEKA